MNTLNPLRRPSFAALTTLAIALLTPACGAEFDEFDDELLLDADELDEDELEAFELEAFEAELGEDEADGEQSQPSGPGSYDNHDGEHQPTLIGGTPKTTYASVMRIQSEDGKLCTATAISHDVIVTAAHCVKTDDEMTDWVKIRVAHGDNEDAEGAYSNHIMMSDNLRDNTTIGSSFDSTVYKRDLAFIKFGRDTFAQHNYMVDSTNLSVNDEVRLLGFGDDDIKETGLKTIHSITFLDNGEHAFAKAYQPNPFNHLVVEFGDSGGPVFVSVDGKWRLVGVISAFDPVEAYFTLITPSIYDHVADLAHGEVSDYCIDGYQHSELGGKVTSLCDRVAVRQVFDNDDHSDTFTMRMFDNYSSWNDSFSSLFIPADLRVVLYEDAGLSGPSRTWNSSSSDREVMHLSNIGWNDEFSSGKITLD